MHRRIAILGLFVAGCAEPASPGTETGDSGEPTPNEEYETPVFVDPASGRLALVHDQVEDLALRVTAFVPGRTQLQIDGTSLGPLLEPGGVGQFVGETLRLRFDGGMVKGTHVMRLLTPGSASTLLSTPVEIRIDPGSVPNFSYELSASPLAQGDFLLATGSNGRGLLGLIRESGPAEVELDLLRADAEKWDPTTIRTLTLPGYVTDPQLVFPGVATTLMLDPDDDANSRLRVAWIDGRPGARVLAKELAWSEVDADTSEAMVALDASAIAGVEWAQLQRPAFVGSHLLTQAYAPTDTETSLPGDAALYGSAWTAGDKAPQLPRRISVSHLANLELAGRVIDLSRDADDRFGVRFDDGVALVLGWGASSTLPIVVDNLLDGESPRLASSAFGFGTVDAAFGSRSVLSASPSGKIEVLLYEQIGREPGHRANPPKASVPEGNPSAPPAVTVSRGTVVFLVPYGDSNFVHAMTLSGEKTKVQLLEGLNCDQVAVPAARAANELGSMSFACLRDGTVRLGALFASQDD